MFRYRWVAVAAIAVAVGACSSTPKRAPYGGQDLVGAVDPTMLVGNWQGRVLNPIEGEQSGKTLITIHADGRMEGTSQINPVTGNPYRLQMTGTWSVDGDHFVSTIESTEQVGENAVAKLTQSLISGLVKGKESRANVYTATSNRLIMVNDESGQAQEWVRTQ